MLNTYFPSHAENRMKNEGNVAAAREYFFQGKNRILWRLVQERVSWMYWFIHENLSWMYWFIQERFSWMNQYIRDSDETVIELGCGAGLSKQFIESKTYIMTDVADYPWVDRYMDAMRLDCDDRSVDVFVCSHMIHHIANPASFLDIVCAKLKPGGRLIIQDIYTCVLMKIILRLMRHEGWSDTVDIYDRTAVCNDAADPWSANCSIPKLLFFGKDKEEFERQFPDFRVLKRSRGECFLFLLSGGVIAKTFHLPLSDKGADIIFRIDNVLTRLSPAFFACGCSVVLQKKENPDHFTA